jgi:hypothetical protein
VVERQLPKLYVVGSIPIARSIYIGERHAAGVIRLAPFAELRATSFILRARQFAAPQSST